MSAPEPIGTEVNAPLVDLRHNFVGDMDVTALLVTKERCLMQAAITDAVRSPSGGASVGMIMTLMDVGASDAALAACRPDWTATQDMSIHGAARLTDGPIVIDNHLVRLGKKVVIVASDIYDGHGVDDFDALRDAIDEGAVPLTRAASGLVTCARIPGTAAGAIADDYDPTGWVGTIRHRRPTTPPEGTLYERMGIEVIDAEAGHLELARHAYVINSIGTINGGAQAVLVEAAAEALCPGLVAIDMQLHYLSQVKAGPARTSGRVLRAAADHAVVAMRTVDAGHDDQLLALGTVGVERQDGER